MRRGGAKLSLPGAMGRQLEPVTMETNSASLAAAERQIKALKLENQKLKSDLADVRGLYKQITQENSHEKFDERRMNVLKSQVIQLERQVLLLTEAIGSRGEVLMEVENALTWLSNKCREYISADVRGPQVDVTRSDLMLMVETSESARIKLFKQLENKTTQSLSKPLLFYNDFLQPGRERDVSLLDVASGNIEHLNLKHVAKLESLLSSLYRELIYLNTSLETDTSNESAYLWTSCHVASAARERLQTQLLKTCALMKDSCTSLLDLSLLYPSAPWPPLKKCALKDITPERVLNSLPGVPRSRPSTTQKVVQALVKAYNYKVYMLKEEISSLRHEVKYHQNVYNLQLKYTESLFQAMREGYISFESKTNELLVKPLRAVLEAYIKLNKSASEKSLKSFLSTFKHHAEQLSDIVETIAVKDFEESEGSRVLSQYGDDFFQALESVVKEQQVKRDREANQHEEIRREQNRLDNELRQLLEEQDERQEYLTLETTDNKWNSNMNDASRESSVRTSRIDASDDAIWNDSEGIERQKTSMKDRKSQKNSSVDQNSKDRSSDASFLAKDWVGVVDDEIRGTIDSDANKSARTKENRKPLHPKEWVGVLEDKEDDSHKEITTGRSSKKPLHPKDWVGVFNPEEAMMGLTISDEDETQLSDAELMQRHATSSQGVITIHKQLAQGETSECPAFVSEPLQSQKPPVKVKKKKLKYVPNTFIPNRTLQLRRTSSQTRLIEEEGSSNIESTAEKVSSVLPVQQPGPENLLTRSRSSSRELGFTKRPAFR